MLWLGAYAVVMLIAMRPMLRWLLRRVSQGDGRLTVVLIAALGSAAATEWLGIHALFGAFFLGALVARDVGDKAFYADRIEPLTLTIFLPLFFAFTGLRTNVFLLTSPWLDR